MSPYRNPPKPLIVVQDGSIDRPTAARLAADARRLRRTALLLAALPAILRNRSQDMRRGVDRGTRHRLAPWLETSLAALGIPVPDVSSVGSRAVVIHGRPGAGPNFSTPDKPTPSGIGHRHRSFMASLFGDAPIEYGHHRLRHAAEVLDHLATALDAIAQDRGTATPDDLASTIAFAVHEIDAADPEFTVYDSRTVCATPWTPADPPAGGYRHQRLEVQWWNAQRDIVAGLPVALHLALDGPTLVVSPCRGFFSKSTGPVDLLRHAEAAARVRDAMTRAYRVRPW